MKREHLKENFPGVYVAVLRQMFSRRQELLDYERYCKGCRHSVANYSHYVFGYLEPWQRGLKDRGEIYTGR